MATASSLSHLQVRPLSCEAITSCSKKRVSLSNPRLFSSLFLATEHHESCLGVQSVPTRKLRRRGGVAIKAAAKTENDPTAGLSFYKPTSYDIIVSDAAKCVQSAIENGKSLLEVEFPALPASVTSYEGSADRYIEANIQLAIAFIKKLHLATGYRIKLVVPDRVEKRRAVRQFKSALELAEGLTLGSLDDVSVSGTSSFFKSVRGALDFDFDFNNDLEEGRWNSKETADMSVFINTTTTELPAIEAYMAEFTRDKPVVLFNLELDTLRSDLGLFGFPSRDVHFRFLSQFTPAFYLRPRDYSKSVAVAPYIFNYSGAVFRMFPGPWQVMLKQGDGSYVCVAEDKERYTLGEAKQELLMSLGMEDEEGSTMQFLRRGYKMATWWEETNELEQSAAWRT